MAGSRAEGHCMPQRPSAATSGASPRQGERRSGGRLLSTEEREGSSAARVNEPKFSTICLRQHLAIIDHEPLGKRCRVRHSGRCRLRGLCGGLCCLLTRASPAAVEEAGKLLWVIQPHCGGIGGQANFKGQQNTATWARSDECFRLFRTQPEPLSTCDFRHWIGSLL